MRMLFCSSKLRLLLTGFSIRLSFKSLDKLLGRVYFYNIAVKKDEGQCDLKYILFSGIKRIQKLKRVRLVK